MGSARHRRTARDRSIPPPPPGWPSSRCSAFAQIETAIRKEGQLEGIAKAKASGVYKERKPSVDAVSVRTLRR